VFRQNTPWDRGDPLWRCTPQRHGVTRLKVSKTSWSAITDFTCPQADSSCD